MQIGITRFQRLVSCLFPVRRALPDAIDDRSFRAFGDGYVGYTSAGGIKNIYHLIYVKVNFYLPLQNQNNK